MSTPDTSADGTTGRSPAFGPPLFALGALASVVIASPPLSLAAGLVLALAAPGTWSAPARSWSRRLIQAAVVLLGFRMDLGEVARAGLSGMAFAAGTIVGTFALGAALGRLLRTDRTVTTLLSAGTAICGGSAIAATSSAIGAGAPSTAVAMAVVFLLNAVALYAFPPIGHALGLTQPQFGAWAAVAIHDVSSVVGAAQVYGDEALQHATAIKLTRALWIAPVVLLAGMLVRRPAADGARRRVPVPWFIFLFVLAAAVRPFVPGGGDTTRVLGIVARAFMSLALFLIGSGLSVSAVRSVGWRALAQGVAMWLVLSVVALLVVRATVA